MKKSLTKAERLKSSSEIRRVFSSKCKVKVPGLAIYCAENDLRYNRIGVTFVKGYGNSVQRNRARRIIKEIYRNRKAELNQGFDIMIVVHPGMDRYSERERQMISLFQKAGIFAAGTRHSL